MPTTTETITATCDTCATLATTTEVWAHGRLINLCAGCTARRRLGSISHVLPMPAFRDDFVATGAEKYADLSDADAAALLAKYDHAGHWIARREDADQHRAEAATVGCILPNGDTVEFRCEGPEVGRFPRDGGVNWCAMGTQTPDVTSAFAAALAFAAGVAATLAPNTPVAE